MVDNESSIAAVSNIFSIKKMQGEICIQVIETQILSKNNSG